MVEDLRRLLGAVQPEPGGCWWGVSIGGLHAACAVLEGAPAAGLDHLNTLREIGPRIARVNTAIAQPVAHGGVGLFLDPLFPLLFDLEFAAPARPGFLGAAARRSFPRMAT